MGSDNKSVHRSPLTALRLSSRDVLVASVVGALTFVVTRQASLVVEPLPIREQKAPVKIESLANELYGHATQPLESPISNPFDLTSWTGQTKGGLTDEDRVKVAELYGAAPSVFEWGVGESTRIAAHVGVHRYVGVDSDAAWIATARNDSPERFRFYFADIGRTEKWGAPANHSLPKIHYDYQIAPLLAERDAFDVYMVDGESRARSMCAIMALLHSTGRKKTSRVLVHDYYHEVYSKDCKTCKGKQRTKYHVVEQVADLVDHSGGKLAVFRRKPQVTDEQLLDLWHELAEQWRARFPSV